MLTRSTQTSSTEKLLHLIKGKGDSASNGGKGDRKSAVRAKSRLGKARRGGSTACIGVDIAPAGLRLVRIESGGRGPELSSYWTQPYPEGLTPDSSGFAPFLARTIKKFRGTDKKAQIWSLVSSAQAEMWHIRVPKVPRSRLSEAVYWTAMKEKTFDPETMVMDYEVQAEVMDKGVPKIQVLVYMVPREVVDKTKAVFAAAGIKPSGLTISPLALQSLFRSGLVTNGDDVFANIYIGRNWSRIDLFSQGDLILSRGVNTGISSLVAELADAYNRQAEAPAAVEPPVPEAPAEIDEPRPFELEVELDHEHAVPETVELEYDFNIESDGEAAAAPEPQPAPQPEPEPTPETPPQPATLDEEQAHALLLGKLLGKPIPEDIPGRDLDTARIIELAEVAVSRLVRQIERTFEHHMSSLGGSPVQKIFFSGDLCTNHQFLDALSGQLGLDCLLLDPLGELGARPSAPDVPEAASQRLAYNLVCGLALCDTGATPNLLRTYQEKDKDRQIIRQGNVVYGIFLVLVAILAGVWLWQQNTHAGLTAELDNYNTVLASFQPQVDENLLLSMAGRVGKQQKQLKALAQKYEGLAAITELGNLTPEGIRLVSMGLELGSVPAPKAKNGDNGRNKRGRTLTVEPAAKVLVLDGVVLGSPEMFDATLATYLARLQNSPLFSAPVVHKREVEPLRGKGDVLRFILHINMS